MAVTNSASGFDGWDKMTVSVVVDEQAQIKFGDDWFAAKSMPSILVILAMPESFRARRGDTEPHPPTDSESTAPVQAITSRAQV